jgi:hypothetical protein
MDLLGGYGSDGSESGGESDAPAPSSTAAKPPPAAASVKTSRRGKRIVSLHAVLPTHILDQLEKSTTRGDLDSDDDALPEQPKYDGKRHAVVGKDEGLSSFLSDLRSAPSATFLGGNVEAEDKKSAPSQPLGHAFTTTTSVTLSRSNGDNKVLDVHATKPETRVSTVTKKQSEVVKPAESRSFAAVTAVPRPSVSVPRPGTNRPIALAKTAPPQPPAAGQVPMQQSAYYKPDQDEEPKVDPRRAKKRSRKEMEKALRSGNLSALESSDMTTLEAEGSVYVPQEETYAVPSSGAVRMTSVRMYDPKAGSDVVQSDVTGKQRGKHQINQLLASAASLELQRARAVGGGAKPKRADAKRKYGW